MLTLPSWRCEGPAATMPPDRGTLTMTITTTNEAGDAEGPPPAAQGLWKRAVHHLPSWWPVPTVRGIRTM